MRVRDGRLRVAGVALPSLDAPAEVLVRVARKAGARCRPLAGGRRRACGSVRARAAAGVRSWRLSVPYRGGEKRRFHVAATLRQAGAPDATEVRRARPR